MESAGFAGSVQVSAATHELIRDEFVCEPLGIVSVKGKGAWVPFSSPAPQLRIHREAGYDGESLNLVTHT
jgi:class 3 adenylate cyclase